MSIKIIELLFKKLSSPENTYNEFTDNTYHTFLVNYFLIQRQEKFENIFLFFQYTKKMKQIKYKDIRTFNTYKRLLFEINLYFLYKYNFFGIKQKLDYQRIVVGGLEVVIVCSVCWD